MISVNKETHKNLFLGHSLKIGQILWYILKADNEMRKRLYPKSKEDSKDEKNLFKKASPSLTDFGKEVRNDEIHWWIFKKEKQIDDLKRRTTQTLASVEKLRSASKALRANPPNQYELLIDTLNNFSKSHNSEIDDLYNYVSWLHKKDVLAPSILFTHRVWGSSGLADRSFETMAATIEDESSETIEIITEMAFGLRRNGWGYTLESTNNKVSYELYEKADPEKAESEHGSLDRILIQTSYETLNEFTTLFKFIRNSLHNVLLDIEQYKEPKRLMKSEKFWQKFIEKVIQESKVESQLWDFKQTLDMWHIEGQNKDEAKAKAKLKFSEGLACFANAEGGVLIIGVSDSPPRKIYGIGNSLTKVEGRLKYTRTVIADYIDYPRNDIVHFIQVMLVDESDVEKICLVIVVPQTKEVVGVKNKSGGFNYPIRRLTGKDRISPREIAATKLHIEKDNYDFVSELEQYIYDK